MGSWEVLALVLMNARMASCSVSSWRCWAFLFLWFCSGLVLDEHTMGVLALFLRFCSLLGFGEYVMLDICSRFVIGGVSIGSPLVDKHAIISIIWFAHL